MEPTTHAEALAILESGRTVGSRTYRKIANNTYLGRLSEDPKAPIGVRLHSTNIVTFHSSGSIVLDSGGHRTKITIERINRYLPEGLALYQKDFAWYLHDGREAFFLPDLQDRWHKYYCTDYVDGVLILPDASLHAMDRDHANTVTNRNQHTDTNKGA